MNGILGMTELLLGTPLNDKQRRFAQAVYRSGESLLEIINDILDFAKIEAGRLELASSDFVLRTLVEDTLGVDGTPRPRKGLELSFREQPGLPAVIHGDPLRLRQILTNLVANAIKFTEHGEVVVDIRRAIGSSDSRSAGAESMELEFMVRDTGIGIPSDMIPRLFSAFCKPTWAWLAAMAARPGAGHLQAARRVDGRPDRGAQCPRCRLGILYSAFPSQWGDAGRHGMLEEPDMPSFNVLVVDDNETKPHGAGEHAVGLGYVSRWPTILWDALDMLMANARQDADFDLALVDMNMPRLDGKAWLKPSRPAAATRI